MNMLSPMNVKNYIAINNNLLNIYNEVASANMSTAANETKEIISKSSNNNDVSACQVSVDGTWQERPSVFKWYFHCSIKREWKMS